MTPKIIEEIAILYQRIPEVKEYYQVRGDDAKEVVKKYKDIIKKEFTEGKGRPFPKGRLSAGKKAVSDFKKLTDDAELTADVMLTYSECVSSFNDEYSVQEEEYNAFRHQRSRRFSRIGNYHDHASAQRLSASKIMAGQFENVPTVVREVLNAFRHQRSRR